MSHIIAVANQKGGVGKTTTCVNLAAALAYEGQRVLLFDMDPQGNATMGSGVEKNSALIAAHDVLLDEVSIADHVLPSTAGYDVLPANADLTIAEVGLLQMSEREHRLAKALSTVRDHYDYILIDCPPALNMLTVNVLVAADSVLIPVQCEYYALEGLTDLMGTIETIRVDANPKLQIEGVLRTMYDGRNSLTNRVSEELLTHFGSAVYETVIPRNVRLAEAPSFGLPILLYDKNSSGSFAYRELADEILQRHGGNATDDSQQATKTKVIPVGLMQRSE